MTKGENMGEQEQGISCDDLSRIMNRLMEMVRKTMDFDNDLARLSSLNSMLGFIEGVIEGIRCKDE